MKTGNYLTILDFKEGKVFQYKISAYFKTKNPSWNPDSESCEEFITDQGHSLTNCEWIVHVKSKIYKK